MIITVYIGVVSDRLNTLQTKKTKHKFNYAIAHHAAEQLCKRTYGERGVISVIEKEITVKVNG